MPRGPKSGVKYGGRQKGTPNKMTDDIRKIILEVAGGLGGAEGLLKWAQAESVNERIFWSNIYVRLLPKEIKAEVDTQLIVKVNRNVE